MNVNNQTLKRSCTRRRAIQSTKDEETAKVLTQLKQKTQRRQAKLDQHCTQRDASQNIVNRLESFCVNNCSQSYSCYVYRSSSRTAPTQRVMRQRKTLKSRKTRRPHNRLSHTTNVNDTNTSNVNKCYTQHTTYVILDDGEQLNCNDKCRLGATQSDQQAVLHTSTTLNDELVFNVITSERKQL
jgi:hypothetical protein